MTSEFDTHPDRLPPQPDPTTGQPRPPRAPRSFVGNATTPNGKSPRRHPALPGGQGPVLEWQQDSPTSAIVSGLIAVVIVGALPTIEGGGFWWISTWWWWLIILLPGVLIYLGGYKSWLAAGATWLQNYKSWVSLYELTDVAIKASGANHMLRLTDSSGRSIGSLRLRDIQRNQALWDLVYNGILHSVTTGKANPKPGTRKILKLPETN